jgi:hypothetical protein
MMHIAKHFSDNELRTVCRIINSEIAHGEWGGEAYREIQIHGELRFDRDFETVVLPRRYQSTEYENMAREFTFRNGLNLEWYEDGVNVVAPVAAAADTVPKAVRVPRKKKTTA